MVAVGAFRRCFLKDSLGFLFQAARGSLWLLLFSLFSDAVAPVSFAGSNDPFLTDACAVKLADRIQTFELSEGNTTAWHRRYGVFYAGRRFPWINYRYSTALDGPVFSTTSVEAPHAAVAKVVLLNGIGGPHSHAGSMLLPMSVLSRSLPRDTQNMPSKKRSRHAKLLDQVGPALDLPGAVALDTFALDLPWCGLGTRSLPIRSLHQGRLAAEENAELLRRALLEIKGRDPQPLIVVTRSASAMFPLLIQAKEPGLINGVVLISATHPSIEERSRKAAIALNKIRNEVPNLDAFKWAHAIFSGFPSAEFDAALENVPSLVLFGRRDGETPVSELESHFNALAQSYSDMEVRVFERGGHDLLAMGAPRGSDTGNDPEVAIETIRMIHAFSQRIARGSIVQGVASFP